MVERTQNDATRTLQEAKAQFLASGDKSENYQNTLDYALDTFIDRLPEPVETPDEITERHVGDYARYLGKRIDAGESEAVDGGISKNTAWTYYDCVSAWLTYCVRWGWLTENPAQKQLPLGEMPDRPTPNSAEQQFWTAEQRAELVRHVDRRADDALEEHGLDAIEALRDRALVYVLSWTGARGGELLSDPRDDDRTGIVWDDLHPDENYMEVQSKGGERENVVLPPRVHGPLDRLHDALRPPSDDWPVFPTLHQPSLYRAAPDGVDGSGDTLAVLREHDAAPPSMTTNGLRSRLKDLTEAAEIEVDGDRDYLQPHGARRGLGKTLVESDGMAAAQRTLRHKDPETTAKQYDHVEAGDLAETVEDALER